MADKKKKDYFSNFFTKKQPQSDEKPINQPFDESYFDIQVIGGHQYSQLIEIKGVTRVGAEYVKLKCSWFLISP